MVVKLDKNVNNLILKYLYIYITPIKNAPQSALQFKTFEIKTDKISQFI